MKILLWIILILSILYVGGMIYCLCYIAGEADDADEEIWENFKKRQEEKDD